MSCSLDMLSEEEGKKDVRGARHIKAYFWSIVVCPLTLHSLSCFLQKATVTAFMVLGFS
jgi:hypothetical protein